MSEEQAGAHGPACGQVRIFQNQQLGGWEISKQINPLIKGSRCGEVLSLRALRAVCSHRLLRAGTGMIFPALQITGFFSFSFRNYKAPVMCVMPWCLLPPSGYQRRGEGGSRRSGSRFAGAGPSTTCWPTRDFR